MLITIVTITYNASKVIEPTLRSLRSQTWQDFEHLIVDGASTDDTLDIARSLAVPGQRIVSEKDKGLYDAMNKGLRLATGDYILFLNAGDAFRHPDTLAHYAEQAAKGAHIIYSDTMLVDHCGQTLGPRHFLVPERLDLQSFRRGMTVCHQAFMVRRDLAPQYDLQYRFSADYDWCLKCIRASDPDRNVNLHEQGINYLTDGLTDHNKLKSLRERYRIMAKTFGQFVTLSLHLHLIISQIFGKSNRPLKGIEKY